MKKDPDLNAEPASETAHQAHPPNAAPQAMMTTLQAWAKEVGVEWDDVLDRAGISRSTAWRMGKGTASYASAKRVEGVLEQLQAERGNETTQGSRISRLRAWVELGGELLALGVDEVLPYDTFDTTLKAVEEIIETKRKAAAAMYAIRNPLPKPDK